MNKSRAVLSFVLASVIPALSLIIYDLVFRFVLSRMSYSDMINVIIWAYLLMIPLVSLVAFITNIIFPAATNVIKAFLLSLLVWLAYLIMYFISFMKNAAFSNLEFVSVICFLVIPVGVIITISVAFSGWLGARINTLITKSRNNFAQ